MSDMRIVWDKAGLSRFLKDERGVHDALYKTALPFLKSNNAAAQEVAIRKYTKGGLRKDPYAMEVRKLDNTSAAVIHSTNKVAARIGRENGLPHW